MYNKFLGSGARMKNAIAFGTFDGIHIAHREVLNLPKEYKKIAVTFEKPPKMFFSKNYELLMTFEERCNTLKSLGFEEIYALDFETVRDIPLTEFLDFIYKKYNPNLISCGFDYRFGKGAKGDVSFLSKFCQEKGIELKVCEEMVFDGQTVSSTMIRGFLKEGKIAKANSLLLNPFSFTAKVIEGQRRGRTIGFPTINQEYPYELVKLKFGVYKTKVLFDGNEYEGITNIGIRPTFKSDYVISETYIKNFSGDLYGKDVKIIPISFLRDEVKFSSLEELKKQIEKDIT